jgi:hypothetical protein
MGVGVGPAPGIGVGALPGAVGDEYPPPHAAWTAARAMNRRRAISFFIEDLLTGDLRTTRAAYWRKAAAAVFRSLPGAAITLPRCRGSSAPCRPDDAIGLCGRALRDS